MIDPQLATFLVLVVSLYLFVSERLRIDLTALLIPVVLGLLGVLEPAEALAGFGHPAVLTVAGMFVLSRALVDSGAVSALGGLLQRVSRGGERRTLVSLALLVAIPSALVNNTPVVAIFIPIVLAVAVDRKLAPSRLLLPVSYASIFGGCCTVVGTSTTILVSAEMERQQGHEAALGFFEPLPFGLVIVGVGTLYLLLVGPRLLPVRRSVTSLQDEVPTEYVTEVMVTADSPFLGKTLDEAVRSPHPDVVVIEVVRGAEILWPDKEGLRIEDGDLLLVRGPAEDVMGVRAQSGESLFPELRGKGVRRRDVTLVELVISRDSPLVGSRVHEAAERAVPGDSVMAVQRMGSHLRSGIAELHLRPGDTLLVQTEAARLPRLRDSDDFVLLEGLHEKLSLERRAPIVLAVTLAVIVAAALDIADISFLAIGAAGVLVLTGCLQMRRAYRALDLPTLALMAGTVSLGYAMHDTGAAKLLAVEIFGALAVFEDPGVRAVAALAGCYLLTNVLTCLISNTAAAMVLLPIALETANGLGVSERPFVMAVVFGASLALATPIGYQTNLLVLGPGGYRFADFVRVGLPLQIIILLLAVLLLPVMFPLFP